VLGFLALDSDLLKNDFFGGLSGKKIYLMMMTPDPAYHLYTAAVARAFKSKTLDEMESNFDDLLSIIEGHTDNRELRDLSELRDLLLDELEVNLYDHIVELSYDDHPMVSHFKEYYSRIFDKEIEIPSFDDDEDL